MDYRERIEAISRTMWVSGSFVATGTAVANKSGGDQQPNKPFFGPDNVIGMGGLLIGILGLALNAWMTKNANRRAEAEELRKQAEDKRRQEEHEARMAQIGVEGNRRRFGQKEPG